ncbi:uncharacterized protein LOC130711106 isoform X4 [Lotus japonicus]|uniref:uncharacterized protein LOC130711106 isoform X4 n=1 Tax=Lotus japonicus TaxID=34305 RepID=UPI00258D7A8C|nr:uncharacterized protein LOC130711106 isoform X4 [Lotus japonicus]
MAEEEEEEETKALNSIPENKKNKEIKFRGRRLCSAHGGLPPLLPPNCMPLIIIQIPGKKGMHPSTRQISLLSSFGFTGIFTAIFIKPLVGVMNFLLTMEPYVTYGSDDSSISVREVLQVELWAKARCNRCGDVLCHRSFWGVMVLVLGAMVLGCRSAAQGQQ